MRVDGFQPNSLPDARTRRVPNGSGTLPVDALLACCLLVHIGGVADDDDEFVLALLQTCSDVEREGGVSTGVVTQAASVQIDRTAIVDSTEVQAYVAASPLLGYGELAAIDEPLVGINLSHHARETRLNGERHQDMSLIADVLNRAAAGNGIVPQSVEVHPLVALQERPRIFGQWILRVYIGRELRLQSLADGLPLALFRRSRGKLVHEHLHPVTTDDRACTEATGRAAAVGPEPVGERPACRRLVGIGPDAVAELQECIVVGGHACHPHYPVRFRISLAVVEWQSVAVLMLQVELDFATHHVFREEVQSPQLIPNHVVLDAPGAAAVEGKFIMVAVAGIDFPYLCHLARLLLERSPACLALSLHASQFSIGGNTEDGFQREVGIMGPVACEVVGAQLVFRVLSVIPEVDGPLAQEVHIGIREPVGIAVDAADSIAEGENVATLLDGHVTTEAPAAVGTCDGIYLAVGMRIGAEVVAGKLRESPT